MKSHVEFITTPTVDTQGTCLIIHFDNKRYLVGNVHEGLQRACMQQGIRLNKVSDVFLTGLTQWKSLGGLIGTILTLADTITTANAAAAANAVEKAKQASLRAKIASAKKGAPVTLNAPEKEARSDQEQVKQWLGIHGGSNVMQTIATGRHFIFRKGLPLHINEFTASGTKAFIQEPTWTDENIRVWAIPIERDDSSQSSDDGNQVTTISPPPRKRSLDDYLEARIPTSGENKEQAGFSGLEDEKEARRLKLLRSIISDMFDSDWRLDTLVATPLSQVRMPTTIFSRNNETGQIERYKGPMPGGDEPLPDLEVLVRKPWPGALIAKLPATNASTTSMCYIVRVHPQRGKFDIKKALALNVKPGPNFSELTEGRAVLSNDGQTVLPEQVLGPGKVGAGFAMVELPSSEYVSDLISRKEWSSPEIMEGVGAVIWNLGPGVVLDPRLQDFVNEHNNLKHIISSPEHSPNHLSMDAASAAVIRHNLLDPNRFGIPIHDNHTKALPSNLSQCVVAQRGMSFNIAPSFVFNDPPTPSVLNTANVVQGMPRKVIDLAQAARLEIDSEQLRKAAQDQNLPSPEAEIITLGTGSALPSKYRNVSATLLRVPGSGSYLLDCGENTLGQLRRIYSSEELAEVLRDLKMIWISHMHADHHLGTTSIIRAWYEATYGKERLGHDLSIVSLEEQTSNPCKYMTEQKRLFVASEPAMIRWLNEYAAIENYGLNRLVLLETKPISPGKPDTTELWWNGAPLGFSTPQPDVNHAMQMATGLSDLASAAVSHCNGAQGVALSFPTGFKISYSGDCRPSKSFAEIGKDSTVLIHEATFDDDLHGDAVAKKHSTVSEAIGVGIAMGARRIILTHFSQRYQKIPLLDGLGNQLLELEEPKSDTEHDPAGGPAADLSNNVDVPSVRAGEDRLISEESSKTETPEQNPKIEKYRVAVSGSKKDLKIGVAFDFMRVKVKDIMLLEKFTPAFMKLYDSGTSKDTQSLGSSSDNETTTRKPSTKEKKRNEKGPERERMKAEASAPKVGNDSQVSQSLNRESAQQKRRERRDSKREAARQAQLEPNTIQDLMIEG